MKSKHLIAAISASVLFVTGCTTSGKFIVPPDTKLYLYERPEPVVIAADGKVTTRPYFWTPFADIYWPMGLNPSLTYHLVNETQGVKKK